jgi:transcriptional regulator with XRE-family HTH domain
MSQKLVQELERRMKALNLDAKTVSTRAGLGPSFIRDIQRGKSREPKRSALERIATVLGCTVEDLIGDPPAPSEEEIDDTFRKLATESDTTAAVVGGSLLEASLEGLLRARMLTTDDKLLHAVFGGRGPLAGLEEKILIAQAFGLITSRVASDLHVLKDVRNTFAHSRELVSFSQQAIKERVSGLLMFQQTDEPELPGRPTSTKALYLLAVSILMIVIDQTRTHGGTADTFANALTRPS